MSRNPDIKAAITMLDDAHAFCVVIRRLFLNMGGGKAPLDGDDLKGLGEAFGDVMYSLECALTDLNPA